MPEYREIDVAQVIPKLAEGFRDACYNMSPDVTSALEQARENEVSPMGVHVLDQLLKNADMAREDQVTYCHDTGIAVLFVEVGQDVRLTGGSLTEALNEGVRQGYVGGYLRASVVKDPLDRVNTSDNTPALIHYSIVPGDKLTIHLNAKGGGSEMKSRLRMLKPSEGIEGVKDFVVETVSLAGASPCPPTVLGIGIGGSFDYCAYLAKKALIREVGSVNPNPRLAALEDELQDRCNKLGIGPQGMGGINTVMDVFIEVWPCHITSLPVAVNVQCFAHRRRTIVI